MTRIINVGTKSVNLSVMEAAKQHWVGDLKVPDRVVEKARDGKIFSYEYTPTSQRVEAAFLYRAGLSYQRIKRMIGRSYRTVHQWYHNLAHLFGPEPNHHSTIAVNKTNLNIKEAKIYAWAAIDVETFEITHIKASNG